ncbi:MAG: hypothetical protein ACRDAP_07385, partial [Shewanella sp.]
KYDTEFTPDLKGVPSGLYGFHVHAPHPMIAQLKAIKPFLVMQQVDTTLLKTQTSMSIYEQ